MEENLEKMQIRAKFLRELKDNAKFVKKREETDKKESLGRKSDYFKILQPCEGLSVGQELPNQDGPNAEIIHEDKNNLSFLICHEELQPSDGECNVTLESKNETIVDPFADSDNSKDADYEPGHEDNSNDSCNSICESPTEKRIIILSNVLLKPKNKTLHGKKTAQLNQQKTKNYMDNDDSSLLAHCEFNNCDDEVFSSCGYCQSFLCWSHFEDEESYNDCKNHKSYSSFMDLTINNTKEKHEKSVYKIVANENSPSKLLPTKSRKKIALDNPMKYFKQHQIQQQTHNCENFECGQYAQSSCEKCLCLLCLDHFHMEKCDNCLNNEKNMTEIQIFDNIVTSKIERTITREDSQTIIGKDMQEQHCEFINCFKKVYSTCEECFCFLCLDHFSGIELIDMCNKHKPYYTDPVAEGPVLTKDGQLRKRKLYVEDLSTRKKKKAERRKEKFALKPPCGSNCRKKCTTYFTETHRNQMNTQYNHLDWTSQGIFIKGLVDVKTVERRKQNASVKKNVTYVYNLITENDGKKEVCKPFFLSTLGYDSKNDSRVLAAINKPFDEQESLRGKHERKNKIDRKIIEAHVMKYEPTISHYRRKHAPNRLYLPSDITISMMYTDFCQNNRDIKISCEIYRRIVRHDLNISFAHLGHEECESCTLFKEHDKSHVQNQSESCEVCCNYESHKSNYTICRQQYQKDVETAKSRSSNDDDTIYYSADLQKVIMLPRMEQYKVAIFCPRMIGFNESFVPLGPSTSDNVPFAAVWPETISGRNQEDIISTLKAFLIHKRDAKHIVLWVDNCASQNKNWAMFSFLVQIVNSDEIRAETITLKYFEPGHTFMSADSFHHQVEQSLQKNKVYDFQDFVNAVKQSNKTKTFVKVMTINDFFNYQDLSSKVRLRKREPRCYLKNIMSAKAQRGYFNLKFKTCHTESEQTLDFLVNKIVKNKRFPEVTSKPTPRGITASRKNEIVQKLTPLMPQNRRTFWYNLPTSTISNLKDDEDLKEDE